MGVGSFEKQRIGKEARGGGEKGEERERGGAEVLLYTTTSTGGSRLFLCFSPKTIHRLRRNVVTRRMF